VPPNALLPNQHNGTFSDVAPAANADAPIGCMGMTLDATQAAGIKSILGPQGFFVN